MTRKNVQDKKGAQTRKKNKRRYTKNQDHGKQNMETMMLHAAPAAATVADDRWQMRM